MKKIKRQGSAVIAAVLATWMVIPSMASAAGVSVRVGSDSDVQMSSDPEAVYVNNYTGTERSENFNDNWKFYLGDAAGAEAPAFDDSSWESVDLPHDYSIEQEYSKSMEGESGYLPGGTGWYRKSFTVDENAAGKQIRIDFGGVYMDSTIWINGRQAGTHPYGYTPFSFDITDYVNVGGENVITVKVNHQTPSSRWYSGSGIYRSVDLTITDPVHVDLYGTKIETPNLKSEAGGTVNADVTATVVNDSDSAQTVSLTHTVFPKGGEPENKIGTVTTEAVSVDANSSRTINSDLPVTGAELWSTDDPNLYTVRTEVKIGGQTVDTYDTDYGFRYFDFDADTGFSLNGKNMKLKGVCMHHDQGALGAEAWERSIERQVEILKEMGCNSIRVTHNPAADELIDICNEQGILVVEEAFDGWAWAKNGNGKDYARFFNTEIETDNQILGAEEGMTWAQFDLSAMIRRGQNAPSIIMWSLGNEVQEGAGQLGQGYLDIQTKLAKWASELDTTRPVTRGCNVVKGGDGTAVQMMGSLTQAGGTAGFNYAGGGQYDTQHRNHPDWLIYGSETASAVNSRGVYDRTGSGNASQTSDKLLTSYDNSKVGWGATASSAWYDVIQRDFVAGEYVWTGFDYIGEPTPWNGTGAGAVGSWPSPKNSYFGIIDTAGFPKDTYYLYQSLWNDSINTLHILPAWNEDVVAQDGSGNVPVVVYTDAAKVELFFTPAGSDQAQSLGVKEFTEKTTDAGYSYQIYEGSDKNGTADKNLYLTWNVPYADGTITAKAWDSTGAEIDLSKAEGSTSVTTTGKASAVTASADRTEISADGEDLSYITVDITDKDGNVVPDAENNVKFTVEGEGKLIGVDNGRQDDHQSYQDDNRNAFAGKVLAIVQSTKNAGEIKVTASAEGLESSTVTISTVQTDDGSGQGRRLNYYELSKNYYVKTGNMPQLPAEVKAVYSDGSSENMPVDWSEISDEQIAATGTFAVTGVTEAGDKVSVTVNMIEEVAALLNYSTTVPVGQEPVLPESRPAVLQTGEVISASFPVTWGEPDGSYSEAGTVKLEGTANVLGQQLSVTASVRVQEQQITIGDSVSGAAYLTQDIEEQYQSDTLDAIKDGRTEMNPNSTGGANLSAWSNWNSTNKNSDTDAEITFRYDTQQRIGQAVIYFAKDNSGLRYPNAGTTKIYISESGADGSWTELAARETITDKEVSSNVKAYTYDFDPQTATFVKIHVKNPTGTDLVNPSVAITEVALNEWTGSYTTNTDAAVTSMTVNGLEVSKADLAAGEFNTEAILIDSLVYETSQNAAVTELPVYDGKKVLIIESEDHSRRNTFTINLDTDISQGSTDPGYDGNDYPYEKTSATAGSEHPGSGVEGPASNAIDNDTGTWWHTNWNQIPPQEDLWITLELEEETVLDALRYLGRSGQSANGRVTEYKVEVSTDGNEWEEAATGTWENTEGWKLAVFEEPVSVKYVRLTGVHTYADSGNDKFMSAVEIRLRMPEEKTDISTADVKIKPQEVSGVDADHPVTLDADDITVTLADGTKLRYGIDFKIVSYKDNTAAGTATAVLKGIGQYGYSGETEAEFDIVKTEPEITGISVIGNSCKTNYTEGESFDPTGLKLKLTYDNGMEKELAYAGNENEISLDPAAGTELSLADDGKSVKVVYGELETSFTIWVSEKDPGTDPGTDPDTKPGGDTGEDKPNPGGNTGDDSGSSGTSGNTGQPGGNSQAGSTDRAAQTGDTANVLPWTAAAIIAGAATAITVKKRKSGK